MADDFRTCVRAGCRWPAAASLSYRYATRQVWLGDLLEERDPNAWDLCPHHAETLSVMRGWDLTDDRVVVPPMIEPAAPDRVAVRSPAPSRRALVPAGGAPAPMSTPAPTSAVRQQASAPAPVAPDPGPPALRRVRPLRPVRDRAGAARPNRYADLQAELPRLAAEVAGTLPDVEVTPAAEPSASETTAPEPSAADISTPDTAVTGSPADDGVPVAGRTWDDPEDERRLDGPAPPEAEGQLTLPRMVEESVVVPFQRPAPRDGTSS